MSKNTRQIEEKKDEEQNDNTKRRIIMIIIIIIIILSLISSCSCTSNFFGVIGNIFRSEEDVDIDKDPHNEVVKNKELKFIKDKLEISLGDSKSKIGFYYKNIKPGEFSCTTSDAKIATCYVEDDYVVINAYKEGKVTVTLQTKANGKTYVATATVTIVDNSEKGIKLYETSGNLNLAYEKTKNVAYTLSGIKGTVTVTSSDDSIATATIENNTLIITGHKPGKAQITLSITYNGQTYKSVYTINVTNYINSGDSTKPSDKPGNQDKPTPPIEIKPSRLVSLTSNRGNLDFKQNTLSYNLNVSWLTGSISLEAIAKGGTLSYQYKRADKDEFEDVDSIKNLKLKTGENIVLITVKEKGLEPTVYKVVINKETGNYLKNIESDEIDIPFKKKQTEYTVETEKDVISLDVTRESEKQEISYTYRGKPIEDLKDLKLLPGTNVIEVITTYEDETRVYTIKVNKKDGQTDNNSYLNTLTDSLGQIKFNANIYDYNMTVDNDVTSFILSATSESKNAIVTIKYDDTEYTKKNIVSGEIKDLKVGENIITVTSKNGKNTTEYNIIVNRKSKEEEKSDSSLISLTTNKGDLEFKSNKLSYSMNVSWLTSKISLEAIAKNGTLSYEYKRADKDKFEKVDSLENLRLKSGVNTVLITVTSRDKTNKTVYKVDINKAFGNYIKNITSDDIKIPFDKKTSEYEIETTKDVISLKVTKDNKDQDVTYTFRGNPVNDLNNLKLLPGTNVIEVIATHDDETRVYTIKVNKKDSEVDDNSDLNSLVDSLGKISFNSNTHDYYMSVDNNVTSFNLSATSESENATITIEYNGNKSSGKNKVNAEIKDLAVGENEIKVTVNNGKNETSYTVVVNREDKETPEKVNDKLVDIEVEGNYKLNPSFDPDKLNYTVNVGSSKKVTFTLKTDPKAEAYYKYNDGEWTKGNTININDLEYGSNNVVYIRVNEKGKPASEDKQPYCITIIRDGNKEDSIAELSEIFVDGKQVDLKEALAGTAEVEISSTGPTTEFIALPAYDGKVSYDPENVNEYLSNMNPGESTVVTIKVTSKDESNYKEYKVKVTKKDDKPSTDNMAVLKELVIDGKKINLEDAANKTAEIEIEDKPDISFSAIAEYDGTLSYDPENIKEHLNNLLAGESTTITVTVTSKDENTTKDYTVKVTKKKPVSEEESIAKIREIVVNGESVNLDEAATPEGANITIKPTGTATFDAIAEYEGKVTYNYDNVNEHLTNLKPGESTTIVVTVTSKDNKNTKEYKVNITKEEEVPPEEDEYTVEFVDVPTCTLGEECQVTYKILDKDGNDVTTSYEGEVVAKLSGNNISLDYSVRGIIKFTPKITNTESQTLTLSIGTKNDKHETIKFERPDYTFDVQSDNGNIIANVPGDDGPNGKASLITTTNMFETRTIENVNVDNGTLKISGEDSENVFIEVSKDTDIITLSFDKDKGEGTNDLPISIEVDQEKLDRYLDENPDITEPTFDVTVKGNLYGREKTETVKLKISRNYTITIDSGDGVFSDEVDKDGNLDKTRTIPLQRGKSYDLSLIETPYVPSQSTGTDSCVTIVKTFKQYTDEDGNVVTEIKNISRDMKLTAEYVDSSEPDRPDYPLKTRWVKLGGLTNDDEPEPNLFYSEERPNSDTLFPTDKIIKEKLIYPGINGEYTLNITNTLDKTVIIKGLVLEEQTVCVEQGCVNMGFMVRSGSGNTNKTAIAVTHFGDSTKSSDAEKYWLLNSVKPEDSKKSTLTIKERSKDLDNHTGTNRVDVKFADNTNENTMLAPNDYIEITLHWKWVEKDDILDTKIGNIAAEMDPDKNVYALKVGFQYVEVCKNK